MRLGAGTRPTGRHSDRPPAVGPAGRWSGRPRSGDVVQGSDVRAPGVRPCDRGAEPVLRWWRRLDRRRRSRSRVLTLPGPAQRVRAGVSPVAALGGCWKMGVVDAPVGRCTTRESWPAVAKLACTDGRAIAFHRALPGALSCRSTRRHVREASGSVARLYECGRSTTRRQDRGTLRDCTSLAVPNESGRWTDDGRLQGGPSPDRATVAVSCLDSPIGLRGIRPLV